MFKAEKGLKYLNSKNYRKALQCFKLSTPTREVLLNMGNCYRELDQDNRAMECYLKSANAAGSYPLALNNIGLLEYSSGNSEAAMEFYKAALCKDPLYMDAIWNYACALLRSTNCSTGWQHYEYRFKRENNAVQIDNYVPTWDGVSTGKSILVLTEQGFGDKIMFGRYLSYLERYFENVIVMCHPSLNCLYSYPCVTSSHGFSVSVPMCSLAKIFGVVPENYLDDKFTAYKFPGSFNIGVCWNGSPTHANNNNRSCSSNYFSRLASFGSLYSLSPDAGTAKDVVALRPKTWAETASYLLGLDLLVTVDTSLVHLAGTLGVPTIMVQPLKNTDFRWGDNRQPNVWYPSVSVVSNPNSWDKTFATVHEKIKILKENNV